MAIKAFDKTNLNAIRQDLLRALDEIGKKHGIELAGGAMTYSSTQFRCKITASVKTPGAPAQDKADPGEGKWRIELGRPTALLMGFSHSDYGLQFNFMGSTYRLVGLRPRARDALVAQKIGNKGYHALPHYEVLKVLGRVKNTPFAV